MRHLNVWTQASPPRWNASRQETVPDYRWLNEMRKWSLYNNSTVRNVKVIILIELTRKGRAVERCTRHEARTLAVCARCPHAERDSTDCWRSENDLVPKRARRGGAWQGRRAQYGAHACSTCATVRGSAIATKIANLVSASKSTFIVKDSINLQC